MTARADNMTQFAEALRVLVADAVQDAVQAALDQAELHIAASVPSRQVTVRTGDGLAEWLSVAEVSKMLGSSESMIRYLTREGRLRGKKHGRSWRYDPESVRSYMQNPSGN